VKKFPPSIGAVCGDCTSSFGAVISQFIREFRDVVGLLQHARQREKERTQEFFSGKFAKFRYVKQPFNISDIFIIIGTG
jgi:hypothetical protein